MNIGYVRISTKDQNPDRQIQELKRLGIDDDHLFIDEASGKNIQRPAYQKMRLSLRRGDVLYLDALDRLGRNYDDITKEWRYLTEKVGIDVVCLNPSFMNTLEHKGDGALGKAIMDSFLCVFSYIAQHEREEMLRRQAAGIALAKQKGKYKGGTRKAINNEKLGRYIKLVDEDKISIAEACKVLGIGRMTFYRRRKEAGKVRN
jgi:DNA invertase Pin-like site-specific DNA recombinase